MSKTVGMTSFLVINEIVLARKGAFAFFAIE